MEQTKEDKKLNLLERIAVFLSTEKPEKPEVKLEQIKTKNDVVLEFETLEPGAEIFIVSEAAEGEEPSKVALPAGDYDLEDGRLLVIAEDGIVGEVKDAPDRSEEEDAPSEEMEALKAELSNVKEENEKLKGLLEEAKTALAAVKEEKEETKLSKEEEESEDITKSKQEEKELKLNKFNGNNVRKTRQQIIYDIINNKN